VAVDGYPGSVLQAYPGKSPYLNPEPIMGPCYPWGTKERGISRSEEENLCFGYLLLLRNNTAITVALAMNQYTGPLILSQDSDLYCL